MGLFLFSGMGRGVGGWGQWLSKGCFPCNPKGVKVVKMKRALQYVQTFSRDFSMPDLEDRFIKKDPQGMFILWFNFSLGTFWYIPLFWRMVIFCMKQREKPSCTKGNIEPQHNKRYNRR